MRYSLSCTDSVGENLNSHHTSEIALGGIRNCKEWKGTIEIGDDCFFGAYTVINRGAEGVTKIGNNVMIMNLANIGHNCEIGDNVEIGAGVIICGHVKIGDNVKIKSGAMIRNRVTIGEGAVIGMGAVVIKDCEPYKIYVGIPAEETYKR